MADEIKIITLDNLSRFKTKLDEKLDVKLSGKQDEDQQSIFVQEYPGSG